VTWDPATSCGYESAKIASIAVPYLQGRGLDVGCGMNAVWPSAIGVDSKKAFGPHTAASVESEGDDLSMFADATMDYVFSSHTLEHFEPGKVPAVLAEWWRVLKVGGRLVLYLPHADFYPNIGQEGANPDHKWDPDPDTVIDLMKNVGSWTLLENEVRSASNEYSFFQVFRRDE
jgi:predicted SAM-dependent methyltransferase